jgi:hypothetical protein
MRRAIPLLLLALSASARGQSETTRPAGGTAASGMLGTSLFWENDGNVTKPNNSSDRHYTAGAGVAVQWQSPETRDLAGALPSWEGEFSKDAAGTSFRSDLR